MSFKATFLLFIFITFTQITANCQQAKVNYEEDNILEFSLTDPLVFNNGEKVNDSEGWEKRKKEIYKHFEQEVYGVSPEWNGNIESTVLSIKNDALEGKAKRLEILINLSNSIDSLQTILLLYVPNNVRKPPVFLGYNFHGNHTVSNEEDIILTKNWVRNNYVADVYNNRASENGRGAYADRWPIKKVIENGFAVATLYSGDIDPDYDDGFQNGIHKLYKEKRDSTSWGTISAWSWGLSRVMDCLENSEIVDSKRVYILGHSRLGKVALWAGASDSRFALTISNNSGCGGAALYRRNYGETVAIINERFPHWFSDNFKKYNNKEHHLPVDQHELISLIAPRHVYIASASEDEWADPKGEFLSGIGANPVFKLLGKDGLDSNVVPKVNTPLHNGSIGYHLREGEHAITLYDWEQFMDYVYVHDL